MENQRSETPHKKHKTPSENKRKICGACDVNDIEWKCMTCDMFICHSCKKGHEKFPATQDHQISSVKEIAEQILAQLKQERGKFHTYEKELQVRIAKAKQYKEYLPQMKAKVVKDIDTTALHLKKKLAKKIEDEVSELKQGVDRALKGESDDIAQALSELTREMEKIKVVSNTVTGLVDRKDYAHIATEFGTDQSSMLSGITNTLSLYDVALKLELELIPTDYDDREESYIGELEVNHNEFAPDVKVPSRRNSRSRPFSGAGSRMSSGRPKSVVVNTTLNPDRCISTPLSELKTSDFNYDFSVKLPHSAGRMTVIDNQIWCAGRDVHLVPVLTLSGDIRSSLAHADLRFPMAVAQVGNKVVIACDEGYGLLEFDRAEMSLIGTITRGSFCDVMASEGKLYALECTTGKVMVFTKEGRNGVWQCTQEIVNSTINPSSQDTLLVDQDRVYVSASRNKCIFVFKKDGKQKATHSSFLEGKSNYSMSYHIARLCCTDTQGSIMVSDQTDGQILILDRHGKSSELNFTVGVAASDVLLTDNKTLIILEDKLLRAFICK